MDNYISLVEDQMPAPIKQPTTNGIKSFQPILTDITLYNEDKGKINPIPNPTINVPNHSQNQGMSFKEWKMRQEQNSVGRIIQNPVSNSTENNNNILSGVKKHVRFNNNVEPQSLPIIQENAPLNQFQQTKSLPPNLLQNPVERRMELSICDAVLKQQQLEEQQRKLYESRNATPVFAALDQCSCIHHKCVSSNPAQINGNSLNVSPQRLSSPVLEISRYHEARTEALEKNVEILQAQVYTLQQQISYILSLQSQSSSISAPVQPVQQMKSSNPFLSTIIEPQQEPKPKMVDSYTQYTIIEPSEHEIEPKTQSDKTFFNQVLGQVNKILDNTEENSTTNNNTNNNNFFDSRSCKFIDSDTSAISLTENAGNGDSPFNRPKSRDRDSPSNNNKKLTDKSTVMDSLAAKYLSNSYQKSGNTTQNTTGRSNASSNNNTKIQDTIDVSKTCYNYLKKYDLLQEYEDDGDVLDRNLLKSKTKLM
uniref:CSON000207 protein n=1 Tax=Culicoides sonorensis TaxID=179676 RepID=A0A336LPI4_CULSO